MTEYKTLKELSVDHGGTIFNAVSSVGLLFHVRAFTPLVLVDYPQRAIGWCINGIPTDYPVNTGLWKLVCPKKVYTEFLYENEDEYIESTWHEGDEIDTKSSCKRRGLKFIKVLREVEI